MPYNQHAGPIKEDPPERPLKYPADRGIKLDSYRLLVKRDRYPDAISPTSIISFDDICREKWNEFRAVILSTAKSRPGDYVFGSTKFPDDHEDDGVAGFFIACGFKEWESAFLATGEVVDTEH